MKSSSTPQLKAAQSSPLSLHRNEGPIVWHPQQEKLLKQWGEMASANRWMHYNTHLRYVRLTRWFTLPVIILSSITGTMNFAQTSFPVQYQASVPLVIGTINLIMGIITTVGSFLRVNELAEGNRVAALSYGKLASNIRVELVLPVSERTMGGSDFIALCRAEMDRLSEQTPDIPACIEEKFRKSFYDIIEKGDVEFYTPDILRLRSVEIFKSPVILPAPSATATTKEQQQQQQSTGDAATALGLLTEGRSVPSTPPKEAKKWVISPPLQRMPSTVNVTTIYEHAKNARAKELSDLKEKGVVASNIFKQPLVIRPLVTSPPPLPPLVPDPDMSALLSPPVVPQIALPPPADPSTVVVDVAEPAPAAVLDTIQESLFETKNT